MAAWFNPGNETQSFPKCLTGYRDKMACFVKWQYFLSIMSVELENVSKIGVSAWSLWGFNSTIYRNDDKTYPATASYGVDVVYVAVGDKFHAAGSWKSNWYVAASATTAAQSIMLCTIVCHVPTESDCSLESRETWINHYLSTVHIISAKSQPILTRPYQNTTLCHSYIKHCNQQVSVYSRPRVSSNKSIVNLPLSLGLKLAYLHMSFIFHPNPTSAV